MARTEGGWPVYFEQIVRHDIGCAAYVVGSTDAGEAAVIDPRIDMVDELLAIAEREGLRIRYIIETHNHADHISGHARLAELTGAEIAVHRDAGAAYPHLGLVDGQELTLGEVRLRVLHTPGHAPGAVCLYAPDLGCVFTGDTLFHGGPGATGRSYSDRATLEASIRAKLFALPADTIAHTGHGEDTTIGAEQALLG